jgi:asparagine synthase (glutamine-hydrolysing)
MDEPVADPASIPLYYLAQLARRHVTVVLSGEGSDELLGGYVYGGHFKGYTRLKYFKRIPSWIRVCFLNPINKTLLRSTKLESYLKNSSYPLSSYGGLAPVFQDNVFNEQDKLRLYRGERETFYALEDSLENVRSAYRKAESFEFLDQMLFVSMTQWLPDDLLTKADKMTMAHSLELRVPFLDHLLVDFITRMPTTLKVNKNGKGYDVKYALKKAFADMIPRETVEREKLGFAVPYAQWFKKEMREMVYDVLLSKTAQEFGLFDPGELERLLNVALAKLDQSKADVWDPEAKKIWSLLVFELWRLKFGVVWS